MEIQAFGYLGVGSTKVEDWCAFVPAWLGMQEVDRGGGMRAFRMDDRKQRFFVDRGIASGTQVFGWRWRMLRRWMRWRPASRRPKSW